MRKRISSSILLTSFVITLTIWIINPSWGATTIYGPKKFIRGPGKPITVTDNFSAPSIIAHYKLIILNGEDGKNRVSSANLKINGIEILKEKDFNQQVERIERSVSLQTSNILSIELKSAPESFITVWIECLDCLDITIISPSDGSTINTPIVLVKGTFLATSDDVGISVNDFPAGISGNNWVVRIPLFHRGSNTITAKITDFYGNGAQKSININLEVASETLNFSGSPGNGSAPLLVTFNLSMKLGSKPVSYQVDYDGDGQIDYIGPVFENITHTYDSEGIYYPTIKVIDEQGKTYSAITLIHITDKNKIDALLRRRWEGMRVSLSNQDIEGAIQNFSTKTQGVYKELFTALKPILQKIVNELNTAQIYLRSIKEDTAEYDIVVTREGTPFSFHLQFIKEFNGIWKIWRY